MGLCTATSLRVITRLTMFGKLADAAQEVQQDLPCVLVGQHFGDHGRLSPSTVARVQRLDKNRRLPGISDTLETVQADSVHQVNNAIA